LIEALNDRLAGMGVADFHQPQIDDPALAAIESPFLVRRPYFACHRR